MYRILCRSIKSPILPIHECNCSKFARIRYSSSFIEKTDKPASPFMPAWVFLAKENPIRPILNELNLWRYRRYYDRNFDAPACTDFARQRYFALCNAVANEDLQTMQKMMTLEAFNHLADIMKRNRDSERKAWQRFMKLDPSEHELDAEKVLSVHFRNAHAPVRSADDTSDHATTDSKIRTKLIEIYFLFGWYHHDLPRKQLIKIGYQGAMVNRADVFRPLVVAYFGIGKDVVSPSSDWLITRSHLLVLYDRRKSHGYMARIVRPKSTDENRDRSDKSIENRDKGS